MKYWLHAWLVVEQIIIIPDLFIVQYCITKTNVIGKLHTSGIIHGDLTTSNMLLRENDGTCVLIDFGLATFYKDPVTNKHVPYKDLKTMTGTAR